MSLGDFVEVLEQNRQALLAGRLGPRDLNGTHARTAEPADRETNGSSPSPFHFPLELTEPAKELLAREGFDRRRVEGGRRG